MSLAAWHLLILWVTRNLLSLSRISSRHSSSGGQTVEASFGNLGYLLPDRSVQMQLVHCPRMSAARFPYVSEFEYVPRLHPSRNPDCPSRFPRNRQVRDEFSGWDRPSIEVKAMLSPCSKFAREKTFDTLGDRLNARWERNYEGENRGAMKNCTRKIFISLKFINIGKTQTEEKFVVIDHVLEPATMRKIPLQSPFVIKVRQETVLQMYGLKFQSTRYRVDLTSDALFCLGFVGYRAFSINVIRKAPPRNWNLIYCRKPLKQRGLRKFAKSHHFQQLAEILQGRCSYYYTNFGTQHQRSQQVGTVYKVYKGSSNYQALIPAWKQFDSNFVQGFKELDFTVNFCVDGYQQRSWQNFEGKLIDRATFNKVVNAEAREEVINNGSPNYMGCNVHSDSPTCGQTFYREEPVPFSQGFCCSCDPELNTRHQFGGSNDSLESFHAGSKSNYNDGTNTPRNRLRTETEYTSLDDNRMAHRQTMVGEGRSEKKPNTDANPNRSRTIGSGVPDIRPGKDARGKPIHAISVEGSRRDQETEKLNGFLARTSQASTSPVTNSILREKYSKKQVEGSSTFASPLSKEVEAGRSPSGDKISSRVDVAQDRASGRKNEVPGKGSGRTGDTARNQDRVENGDEGWHRSRLGESVNRYGSTSAAKNLQFAMEAGRNLREPSARKKEIGKGKERGIAHVTRLVDSSVVKELNEGTNQSPSVIRLADPLRSTKYGYRKKLATGRSKEKDGPWRDEKDTGGKGCNKCSLPDTLRGGFLVKSGKRTNKVFPVASAIDSPAIRPAMHLDEALKNLSTDVLNGNKSPASSGALEGGNLNSVMESTSHIIAKGLTEERRVGGYVRSNVNDVNKDVIEEDRVLATEETVSLESDSLKREKKLRSKEAIKNYTPQKRTLKDYSSNYNAPGTKSLHRYDANSCRTKENFRRSRRHLRGRKGRRYTRRGSKVLGNASSGRGRRKRAKEMEDDKGTTSRNQNSGAPVQVYIDDSRLQKARANAESKLGKLAHGLANNETTGMAGGEVQGAGQSRDDSILGKEANRQDSVDKQIEEKFSRISDALKEDAMGPKVISKETQEETTNVDQQDETERLLRGGMELWNKFNQANDVSSRLGDNETPGETGAATETVLHDTAGEFIGEALQDSFTGFDQSVKKDNELDGNEHIYLQPRKDQEAGEHLLASQQSNPSVNNFDEFAEKSSITSNSDFVISPTIGSLISEPIEASAITQSTSALEEVEKTTRANWKNDDMNAPKWLTEEATSERTQALIVIDVFKVVTDPLQPLPGTMSDDQVREPSEFKPVHRTVEPIKTTTLLLTESTVATERPTVVESTAMVVQNTTTSLQATIITDETFRPSRRPYEDSMRTGSGGAEFDKEVDIGDITFPDETDLPITTDRATSVPEKFAGLESISGNTVAIEGNKKLRMGFPGKKKKRRTAAMIKSKDLPMYSGHGARRNDRSLYSRNPVDYVREKDSTRPDSAMKFSLEAANVDLVKEKMGVTSSFFRAQRNYVQLRVDARDKHRASKGVEFSAENYEPRVDTVAEGGNEADRRRGASSDRMLEWMHPWFVTTETSEYTVRPKFHYNHLSSSHGKPRENPSNQVADNIPGRILPPCTEDSGLRAEDGRPENVICVAKGNQRGRRLLSVRSFRGIKNAADHRSTKNQKKVHADEDNFINEKDSDDEYEEGTSEHRKHLKAVRGKDHEKSKKRDASRCALKRKNKEKNRSKKQSISADEDPSEDDDYLLPEEREYDDGGTFLEEREADAPNSPEEFLENYEGAPDGGGHLEDDLNGASKTSADAQEGNSYNRLIDDSAPVGFDKFAGSLADLGAGKDFEISLTGKIHLESDSNGRPVSISFNAAPEFLGKDSTGDGKMDGYGNRFPSDSASSFIGASDTLAPLGTDNANFLSDVFDGPVPLNVPPDSMANGGDRSNSKEYYPGPTRSRVRSAERYGGELAENRPQRLLHLQKKSVETSGNLAKGETGSLKDYLDVNGRYSGPNGNLNRLKKEPSSLAQDANFAPEETEVEDDEKSSDIDQNESLNVQDRNRVVLSSSEDSLKKTPDESLEASPQISLDLSGVPENSLAGEQAENRNTTVPENSLAGEQAENQSTTGPEISLAGEQAENQSTTVPEISVAGKQAENQSTTVPGNSTMDIVVDLENSTMVTSQDTDTTVCPNSTRTTISEQLDTATTVSFGDATEGFEDVTAYPNYEPAEAYQLQNESEYSSFGGEDKETIEKKNMLAVADFVKKLENLVNDTGNSSNEAGRTLIHLKKFIIVPDNQTLWSVKELAGTVTAQQTTSTEEIIMIGEGAADDKSNKNSLGDTEELDEPETEIDQKLKADDSASIKEIISSVIRGNKLKRGVAPERTDGLSGEKSFVKAVDYSAENKDKACPGKQELNTCLQVGKNCEDSAKPGERTSTKEDASLRNVGENTGDQFLETHPENAKEPLKKDTVVCTGNTPDAKEKREASASNANSVSHKGGNKSHDKGKDARHVKKKRRRKRKRKLKRKKGDRKKKNNKKAKNKWPFKRNLLMLSEKEQIETSSINDGTRWKILDRLHEGNERKARSSRKSRRENMLKEPHIRGGQDCRESRHPPNVDLFKYRESTHCLRFSDLWYSVYQLEEPVIDHRVHIEIYEKRSSIDGSVSWRDLTNGSTIRLGTVDRHYRSKEDTLVVSYSDAELMPYAGYNLDHAKERLLVPSRLTGEGSTHPVAEGWSGEYLVVQADKINEDANECDKAGVGFTAFVEQPDRCGRVRGTCLKNQPLAYWRRDMEARESGRAGCYFLSNFARVPSEAIKYNVNGTGSREFLALEYHSPHVSVIDVELRADYNALLRAGSSVRLTEVQVDNTAIDYTVITVLITNRGSSSSPYRARITDCPRGLPVSWLNAESPTKIISPHRDRKITLNLHGRLSLDDFSCSVELLNGDGETVATRPIKVRKMDRCFCVRHCACSCMANAHGASCQPMLLENYHATGFRGSIPTTPVESPIWSNIITILALLLTALLLILLFMGFLKWIIGLFVPAVSRWGLDAFLYTDKMSEYFEKDLKSKRVVFDQFGAPVHPDTSAKTVRICNRKLEFFLNLLFFLLYPFAFCLGRSARPQRPSQPDITYESKTSLMTEKDEPPKMVRVSTYGDGINSKMEAEDTRYVIDELKKSQESLQNHSRQKRNRGIVREPSSSD